MGQDQALELTEGVNATAPLFIKTSASASMSSQKLDPPSTNTPALGSDFEEAIQPLAPYLGFNKLDSLLLWKFEVISVATSVAALVAISGILLAYDDKPMSHWHVFVRPNTVVSILSTLAKSSMLTVIAQGLGQLKWDHFQRRPRLLMDFELFDDASKGPLGSTLLLFRMSRLSILSCLGATITILAVAMDPFAQQVIYYDSKLIVAGGKLSTIGTARIYDMDSTFEKSTDASAHTVYSTSYSLFTRRPQD